MTNNFHSRDDANKTVGETVSIHELTRNVIQSLSDELSERSIAIDADLPSLTACVQTRVMHRAVAKLLENAIDAMPMGGQISVTLIDGQHHWELEVADSAGEIFGEQGKANRESENSNPDPGESNLLRVVTESPKLALVRAVAAMHGGQVQSWKCPQGGTANVLVIPRTRGRNRADNAA